MDNTLDSVKKEVDLNEVEKLKRELFETRSNIEYLLLDIEKAKGMLDYIIFEYDFPTNNEPDWKLLLRNAKLTNEELLSSPTTKWVSDYKRIYQFANIAYDYIDKVKESIEKIID